MRTLLTLIKRQIIDNAVCFAVASLTSVALVFGVAAAVFTEDHTRLSDYTRKLLVTAPFLVGMGCCVLGIVQARIDTARGIATVLAVLPVRRVQILAAQIITGVCVIMTILGPLGLTAVFFWKLYGPPDWLFHPWVADSFTGLSLAALACYLFGLQAGRRAKSTISALLSLPLAVIVLLLVLARGFGPPLLAVLIPLILVLLLRCWTPRVDGCPAAISAGITVLVCLPILLCCCRNWCNAWLVNTLEASARISHSGLLPWEIEHDPNVEERSEVRGRVTPPRPRSDCLTCNLSPYDTFFGRSNRWEVHHYLLENSGIIQYFLSCRRGRRTTYSTPVYEPQSHIALVHLDETEGQLVYRHMRVSRETDRYTWDWSNAVEIYAGPRGVSEDPDKVGRFSSATIYFEPGSPLDWDISPRPCIVYERDSRCFYAIDFDRRTVRKGHEVQDSSVRPVGVDLSSEPGLFSSVDFRLPRRKDWWFQRPIDVLRDTPYMPLVSQSGRIDVLDLKTLELFGPAGHLPEVPTPFGSSPGKPSRLKDFSVEAVWFTPSGSVPGSSDIKTGFAGILAMSVSRQGTWASLAVFDEKGDKVKIAFSKADLLDKPLNSMLTVTKYALESLHPPILTLASFLTAYSFEARASHRALFLMPNSFAAMVRDREGNIVVTLGILLLVMLPGLALAGWLSRRVVRDAATIGLSLGARRFWLAATIAFGLAGYITYRLSRPKVTLVTCANCGKGRRPDMDICHHCGEKWDVPELAPPAWRVLG